MITLFFGIFGSKTDDFEGWAGIVMTEILVELVVVIVLAVVYVF